MYSSHYKSTVPWINICKTFCTWQQVEPRSKWLICIARSHGKEVWSINHASSHAILCFANCFKKMGGGIVCLLMTINVNYSFVRKISEVQGKETILKVRVKKYICDFYQTLNTKIEPKVQSFRGNFCRQFYVYFLGVVTLHNLKDTLWNLLIFNFAQIRTYNCVFLCYITSAGMHSFLKACKILLLFFVLPSLTVPWSTACPTFFVFFWSPIPP